MPSSGRGLREQGVVVPGVGIYTLGAFSHYLGGGGWDRIGNGVGTQPL